MIFNINIFNFTNFKFLHNFPIIRFEAFAAKIDFNCVANIFIVSVNLPVNQQFGIVFTI